MVNAGGSVEPVGKPPTKEAADPKAQNLRFYYGTGVFLFREL
jgi:hypothetical protein